MKILKSYRFRLVPTKEQVELLKQHGGNSRFTWNKLLEYSNNYKEKTGKYPTQSQLVKHVVQLKKDHEFIKTSHSQPIQINALNISKTFSRAFNPVNVSKRNCQIAQVNSIEAKTPEEEKIKQRKLEKALNFAFPKFKKKSARHDSLFYPQNTKIRKSRIHFPKLGWIKFIKHRKIEGNHKFITIVQDGTQYYASITCEVEIKEKKKPEMDKANIVGIDVGETVFATLSDGTIIENPKTLYNNLKKLKKESKKLSRKVMEDTGKKTFSGKEIKKFSKRGQKQIVKVQKIHRKIRNIRKNFLHKTSCHIINKYDGVVLENLDIQGLISLPGKKPPSFREGMNCLIQTHSNY